MDTSTSESHPKSGSNKNQCCKGCCLPFKQCCHIKYNPLPENASRCQKLHYSFLCPPHGFIAQLLTVLVIVIVLWAVPWAILGVDVLPGGNIFALIIMLIACTFAGKLVDLIRLPPLLGMLIMGFMLQNVPKIDIAKDIEREWSSTLRLIALTVILTRAGLGLNYHKLKQMAGGVFRISILPCSTEAVVAAGLSVVLFKFSWIWAFILGFVHAAVSPAVVVYGMLALQELRLGTNKGIPSMLIAGGSIENVLVISAFSLVLGLLLSEGSLVYNILRCPMEIVVGILSGLWAGAFLWFIPTKKETNVSLTRFILLLGIALLVMFGFRVAGLRGAGALSCLALSFMAAHGWRKRSKSGEQDIAKVAGMVGLVWSHVFQPWLFGLIGAAVKLEDLKGDVIGNAAIIAAVAILCRCVVTFLTMFGTKLNHKEKLFVALAWLPKATVQAAIGSTALDAVERLGLEETHGRQATIILTVAVFIIIVTAPLGATLIALTAPKLLHKGADPNSPEGQASQESSVVGSTQSDVADSLPDKNTLNIPEDPALIYTDQGTMVSHL